MTNQVDLIKYSAEVVEQNNYGAYRLKITATNATGGDVDNYLFVYKRNPASPYNSEVCDEFVAVAGPQQIAGTPIGAPDPAQDYPYYRLDSVTLDLISTDIAEKVWDNIVSETTALMKALDRMDDLTVDSAVTVTGSGALPTEIEDSESLSS